MQTHNKQRGGLTMKRLLALSLMLAAAYASAAPFIVSDPIDPKATHCGWKFNAEARVDVPVALSGTDKICKVDLAGRAPGSYTINATAVAVDPLWGRMESAPSANFTQAVPGQLGSPSGLVIVP
jgi:hypothetical protein